MTARAAAKWSRPSLLRGDYLLVCPRLATIAVIVAAEILAAPGAFAQTEGYQPPQFIQLFVWHDGSNLELKPIQQLIAQYNAAHSDYRIILNPHPTAAAYERLQAWSGPERRAAPDMVVVPSAWLPQFKSLLRSLEVALTASQRAVFYPAVLQLFSGAGRLHAVPWRIGGRGLLVRTYLLAEAGLSAPQTWEEVAAAADKLHDPPDQYGIGLPGGPGGGELLAEIIWACGGTLHSEDAGYTLATEPATQALELVSRLAQFAQPQVLTWQEAELERLFADGRLAMLVTDSWWVERIRGEKPGQLQMKLLPLPAQDKPVGHLIGEGLAIVNGSDHERQCLEFVRMFCQPESQAKLLELGGLPSGPNCGQVNDQDSICAALAASTDHSRSLPAYGRPKLLDALQWAVYLSLSGRQEPSEALATAEKALVDSP